MKTLDKLSYIGRNEVLDIQIYIYNILYIQCPHMNIYVYICMYGGEVQRHLQGYREP